MDGAIEAIMETRCDMAAQKALGHLVVVPHPAIARYRSAASVANSTTDFSISKRGLLRATLTWPAFPAQSPRRRTDRSSQTQRTSHARRLPRSPFRPIGVVRQKLTTRSAVEGIRRTKFTRRFSMSVGDGTRVGPSRSRIRGAHGCPFETDSLADDQDRVVAVAGHQAVEGRDLDPRHAPTARQSIPRICRPWQSQAARPRSIRPRRAARGSRAAPAQSRGGSRPFRERRKSRSSPA